MLKLPLQPTAFQRKQGVAVWESCAPFVDNDRAMLIHRPRMVTIYNCLGKKHMAINSWCGNGFTGTKKFTFLDALDGRKFVCARCEAAATKAGLPSADELSGKHIHLGKVVAVQTCCDRNETLGE